MEPTLGETDWDCPHCGCPVEHEGTFFEGMELQHDACGAFIIVTRVTAKYTVKSDLLQAPDPKNLHRGLDREALADKTSREDKMERRLDLSCSFCRPHKNENATRYSRHGGQKQKGKNKRRG